jgi:hypothetical protein
MINQQKTFIDFNLTLNVDGIVYYHLFIGDSSADVMGVSNIQINLKNHQAILKSKADYMNKIELTDRDERLGIYVLTSGQHTVRFNDMIPQTGYVFCTYIENNKKDLTGPFCKNIMTQNWGVL